MIIKKIFDLIMQQINHIINKVNDPIKQLELEIDKLKDKYNTLYDNLAEMRSTILQNEKQLKTKEEKINEYKDSIKMMVKNNVTNEEVLKVVASMKRLEKSFNTLKEQTEQYRKYEEQIRQTCEETFLLIEDYKTDLEDAKLRLSNSECLKNISKSTNIQYLDSIENIKKDLVKNVEKQESLASAYMNLKQENFNNSVDDIVNNAQLQSYIDNIKEELNLDVVNNDTIKVDE